MMDTNSLNSRVEDESDSDKSTVEPIIELPTMYRTLKTKEEAEKYDPDVVIREVGY